MEWVDVLTNPSNVLAGVTAVVFFATVVTVMRPNFQNSSLESRLKSVATRREELRRRSREAMAGRTPQLRRVDEGVAKRVVDRLQLSRLLEDSNLTDKLAQAGYRGPSAVSRFYFFRFLLPFVMAAAAAIYVYVVNGVHAPPMTKLAIVVAALVAGYYAPNLYIGNVATKRRESIVAVFPDALDLLLICVESGMSIEAAIQKVSQEVGGSSIELAEELSLLTAELSYLPERRQAYEGLAKLDQPPRHQGGGHRHDSSGALRHAARHRAAGDGQGEPRPAPRRRREESRGAASAAYRSDDPVLPARAVHHHPRAGNHQSLGHPVPPLTTAGA